MPGFIKGFLFFVYFTFKYKDNKILNCLDHQWKGDADIHPHDKCPYTSFWRHCKWGQISRALYFRRKHYIYPIICTTLSESSTFTVLEEFLFTENWISVLIICASTRRRHWRWEHIFSTITFVENWISIAMIIAPYQKSHFSSDIEFFFTESRISAPYVILTSLQMGAHIVV